MRMARLRLMLAALAFSAWIGWLAYLAATATRPTVLSRPQILLAPTDVLADVKAGTDGPEAEVTIQQVYWPTGDPEQLQGKKITVVDLPRIAPDGWTGPGQYLLPLARIDDKTYRVVAVPPSPGYQKGQHLIYRITDHNRRQVTSQLEAIPKPAPHAG